MGPLKLFDPELTIVNDDDYQQAIELLQEILQPCTNDVEWNCPACGETVPGSMVECWSCQTAAPNSN